MLPALMTDRLTCWRTYGAYYIDKWREM